MASKHILLVDDQRDVTRMMRSALDTLGRGYIIVDVPSGEEAILEIGRGGVDLLITDVRLPGMSGLDVVKRLRRMDSKAQAILITGHPSAQTQAEAERLAVSAYLTKPIKLDDFLLAVQRALGEKPSEPVPAEASGAASASVQLAGDQQGLGERLSTLRRDLGANAVFLVDREAKVAMSAGDVPRLDTKEAFKYLMTAFDSAMRLSQFIGGFIPSNVHFFDGDDFDIYAANVGQYFALVIVFDGDRGAGQMGPVMRYGRQCADDLLNSIATLGGSPTTPPAIVAAALASTPLPRAASPPPPSAKPPVMEERPAPPPLKPLSETEFKALEEALAKKSAAEDAASFWDAAVTEAAAPEAAAPPPAKPLADEELKALDAALNKAKASSADADSFWDAAVEEEAKPAPPGAMSFEEAQRLGLIPKK